MFEIYGILCENDLAQAERLCANLTCFIPLGSPAEAHPKAFAGKVHDFTQSFADFEGNILKLKQGSMPQIVILPPFYEAAALYARFCDKIIVAFPACENLLIGPYASVARLEKALGDFSPLKEKTLITLSGMCRDYSINSHALKYLTNNQAILKARVKEADIFTHEELCVSSFTYLSEKGDAHIVFVEDTYSLSLKHNMIKKAGFAGICWENVRVMTEGNWETLRAAYTAVKM